ncbi:MAG: discoidin domain-containing protein, partial [Planctomycetota bacterium]
MTAARRLKRRISGAVVLLVVLAGTHVAQAQPAHEETASSELRSGYGALQAADGIAEENGNYWQTLEGQDKGAWWQQDLGQVFDIQGVKITWARYQDKVHCPPATAVVETSLTGEKGSWKVLRSIAPEEVPRDGEPYDADRQWLYAFPEPTEACYLRLSFSDGGQPGARYPGFLCLGEIEVLAPGMQPRIVTIEGPFGKAEVNVTFPAVTRLYLGGPGALDRHSLLARSGPYPWVREGCTYVVGQDNRRYESRLARPENVELSEENGRTVVRIKGVRLSAGRGEEPVATEDWTLSAPGDGSQLVWKIVRRWERDFTPVMSGSPALFFTFHVPHSSDSTTNHSVTSTIWYDPLRIAARPSVTYAACLWGWCCRPRALSKNHVQTVKDRDTWAVYKLWSDWHAPSDLRLEVEGGHLYRRGSYSFVSEAGAVAGPDAVRTCRAGQQDEITLKIGAVDKRTTGYQLAVDLPDKEMEASLADFYGSLFNGGTINDQKGFDYGNESDGFYYSGASWAQALALAAGMPAAGQLSSHPYDAAQAFREHLAHILSLVDDQGRDHFGYNHSGQWVECQLLTILATRTYLLHSGDLAFVRQNLRTLERMLDYFIQRRNAQGLFELDGLGAHWYYDGIGTNG